MNQGGTSSIYYYYEAGSGAFWGESFGDYLSGFFGYYFLGSFLSGLPLLPSSFLVPFGSSFFGYYFLTAFGSSFLGYSFFGAFGSILGSYFFGAFGSTFGYYFFGAFGSTFGSSFFGYGFLISSFFG